MSAREWRSAALEVLGANGSCTWTKSSSTLPSSSSTVRATSIGSAAAAPARAAGEVEHLADGDHARRAAVGALPSRRSAASPRAALRAAPCARRAPAPASATGASTSTRWPRARELAA